MLYPPIPYKGSKRREMKFINDYKPDDFDYIIDLFGGGASVSLYFIHNGYKVLYNDLNTTVCDMFKTIKSKDLLENFKKKCNEEQHLTVEYFNEILNSEDSVFRLIYLSKNAYRGNIDSKIPNMDKKNGELVIRMQKIKHEILSDYEGKLDNMEIHNKNYKDILDEHKHNEACFIYCDPPYLSRVTNEYKIEFNIDDLLYIIQVMRDENTKAKIMLNLDYTGYTREEFNDLFKFAYKVSYNANTKQGIYGKYHLLLCNY